MESVKDPHFQNTDIHPLATFILNPLFVKPPVLDEMQYSSSWTMHIYCHNNGWTMHIYRQNNGWTMHSTAMIMAGP
jgi:hypothetical protein